MEKIVILAENEFRDDELFYPYYRFQETENYEVLIASREIGEVVGEYGLKIKSDISFDNLNVVDFVGVIIPGGLRAPEKLRMNNQVLEFMIQLNNEKKMIAAICHGVWALVSAGILKNKNATCHPAIAVDIKNCGANYIDSPVVKDENIITSRRPKDLPYFMKEIMSSLNKK